MKKYIINPTDIERLATELKYSQESRIFVINKWLEPLEEKAVLPKVPYQQIADIFNYVCKDLPRVEKITNSRKSLINARIKDYSLEHIGDVFRLTSESDFLSGRKTDWKASFDWIMNATNFTKILEGNYKNNENGKQQRQQPIFGRQNASTFIANATGWTDIE